MKSSELNEQLKRLKKESSEKKQQRKILDIEFTKLKEIVKKSGITSLISLLFYTGFCTMLINGRFYALKGIAMFFRPFVFFIFLGSFILFLIKGFDLYINLDVKYSKELAEKFKEKSYSEQLKILDGAIIFLDEKIEKIENELYERGELIQEAPKKKVELDDFDEWNRQQDELLKAKSSDKKILNKKTVDVKPIDTKPVDKTYSDIVQADKVKLDKVELDRVPLEHVQSEHVQTEKVQIDHAQSDHDQNDQVQFIKKVEKEKDTNTSKTVIKADDMIKKVRKNRKADSIENIFSGLDGLDDDDDDDLNSSEMWKNDAMNKLSRY